MLFDVCRAVPGNFCQAGRGYSGDHSLLHNAEYSKDFLIGCIGIESICKGLVKKYGGVSRSIWKCGWYQTHDPPSPFGTKMTDPPPS